MTRMHTYRRNTFIAGFVLETIFLLIAIFINPAFIADCLFCMVVIGIFYLIEQKYPLNPVIILFGMMPLFLHSSGVVLGFFGTEILGIGYDKWIHLLNSMFVAIVAYYILIAHSRRHLARNIVLAVLIMLGINVLQETTEFIGTRYFGVFNESLFGQGNGMPVDQSNDLQVFDTYWDMIFDIIGGAIAAVILSIIVLLEKHRLYRWLLKNV